MDSCPLTDRERINTEYNRIRNENGYNIFKSLLNDNENNHVHTVYTAIDVDIQQKPTVNTVHTTDYKLRSNSEHTFEHFAFGSESTEKSIHSLHSLHSTNQKMKKSIEIEQLNKNKR